ncbi:MAG: hypothetical protein HY900_35065 [Deltaproteobacteria bacterium]|nr:hypothetical protein [Deltaproteobacteria bacterium]
MNDTTAEAARVYRDLLLSRTGADRFRMGCEMFETAKAFVLAGLRAQGEEGLQERLFLRLYGRDYEPEERERIRAAIRKREAR